jgi:hypothetical protein
MAGGQQKSGIDSPAEETEQYTIPAEAKDGFWIWLLGIPIDNLIKGILDYYISDETNDVKKVWENHNINGTSEIRKYLGNKIKELNGSSLNFLKNFPDSTETIQIPTNVAFFREAFKENKKSPRQSRGVLKIFT